MMNYETLNSKVFANMGLHEESLDNTFKAKITSHIKSAVLEMRTAGISNKVIQSDMGTTAIAIICNDLLNINSGEVKISQAYMYYLPLLQAVSEEDLDD